MQTFDPLKPITPTEPRQQFQPVKKKANLAKYIFFALLVTAICLAGLLLNRGFSLADEIFVGKKISFFEKLRITLTGGGEKNLSGEKNGQINILLLGIGGQGHEGPYLTDTIILAQIRPDIGETTLVSIPRDLFTGQFLGANEEGKKINFVFAENFAKHKDFLKAGQESINTVEKVTGLSVPYFALVDFRGFEKAIDEIGGVSVVVERSFTDREFPDEKFGYLSPVSFSAGTQTFNGKEALIFTRSRHGDNGEASDYARSQRQQKIITAFKSKMLELGLFSDAGKINKLLSTFAEHFHTNLEPGHITRLYKIFKNEPGQNLKSLSLDEASGLVCPRILETSGAWVLVVCPDKTVEDVRNFFKNSLSLSQARAEKATVWLSAGNAGPAEFQKAYKKLTEQGFLVYELAYDQPTLNFNIVYPATSKTGSLEIIKQVLKASEVTLPPPGLKVDSKKVDFIVILGKQ